MLTNFFKIFSKNISDEFEEKNIYMNEIFSVGKMLML